MNYPPSHRLSFKSRTRSALPCLVAFLLLLVLILPALPPSSAARATRATTPAATNGPRQALVTASDGVYKQTNLVSDLPGVALLEDPLLKVPWGVAVNPSGPFWVVNHQNDRATLYKGDVAFSPLVNDSPLPVIAIPNVPTLFPLPSQPTGVVANTTNDFVVSLTPTSPAAPAQYIFATLSGGINAWQPAFGPVAVVVKFLSGHNYTGLAIGNNASGNFLYAADFTSGKIDIFDKDFNLSSVSGNFTDATVPANFHPFNIQNLGGSLFVTYAEFSHFASDFGFVRKFDTNGVRDAAFTINNGPLIAPWGMAISNHLFGTFSNALLVGNSRVSGSHGPTISAFNPATGALIGSMVDEIGAPLEIDKLRALVFGNDVNAGDTNTLYFSADIFDIEGGQKHGLFGSIKPISTLPESLLQFSNREYFISEGAGHIDITVNRIGSVSGTSTVNYATVETYASQKSNFEIALGKLTFNPGEASKTFRVLIVDNNLAGGGSAIDLALVLSNPTGAELISPNPATLLIRDDDFDTDRDPLNIIDATQFFVRQQYFDFLNREPDPAGFNFWTNQISSCGTDQQCIELKRINVSAAFFRSIEFESTGMLAYLTEKAAFGGLPRYGSFMRDVQALQNNYVFGAPGAGAQLEANKQVFFDEFITRPQFRAKYGALSNRQYVETLLATGGVNSTTGRLFVTRLTGAQVVPSVNTSATGLGVARINFDPTTVNFSLWLSNLSSVQTSAHLHGPAQPGANAPPVFTLPNGQFNDFTIALTTQQGGDLRGGRMYFDVHTQNHPDGEVRGQIPFQRFLVDTLVAALDDGTITRAQALRLIAEDIDFRQKELNPAFVLMEYFGYLRRNPDDPPDNNLDGYNFWLAKLNQFNGNFVDAEMVKAFLRSTEYRRRFGPP